MKSFSVLFLWSIGELEIHENAVKFSCQTDKNWALMEKTQKKSFVSMYLYIWKRRVRTHKKYIFYNTTGNDISSRFRIRVRFFFSLREKVRKSDFFPNQKKKKSNSDLEAQANFIFSNIIENIFSRVNTLRFQIIRYSSLLWRNYQWPSFSWH